MDFPRNDRDGNVIYDVLIIGAGISGCMTAYKLARYNVKTAVAEAGADVAWGSTRANSAIVHAGYDPEPGTLKARLNVRGCGEMPELCRLLEVKYLGCGSLVAAFSEEERPALDELYKRGIENGVPGLEIIERDRLLKLEPNISDGAVAALWSPTAGIICPYGLCIAAAEAAACAGTDFIFEFKVKSIKKENGVFRAVSEDGRNLFSKYLVNAAGLYADEIAEAAGETDFPAKIIPRRGEYLLLDRTEGKTVNRPLFSVPTKEGKGILLTPTVDGNLIIGPNAHNVESACDTSTTSAGLAEVVEGVKKKVKNLNLRAVITSFAGIRPTPACGDFYIKPSEKIEGLLHIAGIESPGLASSPAIGEYAVELLRFMGLMLTEREGFDGRRPPETRPADLADAERQALIMKNPAYGRIVCRCEGITEGEIVDSIRRPLGARSLDSVKRRTRAGMGRCQGGFCSPRVAAIIARETGVPLDRVTKNGGKSFIITGGRR